MSDGSPCVLAIMAHPDDIEFLCAGTLCRLREAGWRVELATMTPGDCGSAELPPEEISAIRRREAAAAAAVIGARYHCVECRDLFVLLGEEAIRRTVEVVRAAQPDVVLTHSPADYLLDHEQTSQIVRNATFAGPIRNVTTGAADPQAPTAGVPHLYYADPIEGIDPLGRPIPPSFAIDISGVIDRKEAMLACHASQREWLLRHHGIDEYLRKMRAWSAERGATVGVAYAEGFRQHLGHAYPRDNRLGEVLGGLPAPN